MIQSYLPVVVLLGIALIFVGASFLASTLLAPKRRTMAKTAPYESGIVPDTDLPSRFSVKFYLIAIAFIVVDVEVIFLYPFSTILTDKIVDGQLVQGLGTPGFLVILTFLGILLVPFAYLLASGALSFGPRTPRVSSMVTPVIKSQGFVATNKTTNIDTGSSDEHQPQIITDNEGEQ